MQYLFGDSTPSSLTTNFIEFLRDAIDCSVKMLVAEQAVTQNRGRRTSSEQSTKDEIEQLERLASKVSDCLDEVPTNGDQTPLVRCKNGIGDATRDIVDREIEAARARLAQELAQIENAVTEQITLSVEALEALLVVHDLPNVENQTRIALSPDGNYSAELCQQTPYGLTASLSLEIPADSVFASDLRVADLTDNLEINAPELGGWIRKETRMVPHKLAKFHVTELTTSTAELSVKLRATMDASADGYDLTFSDNEISAWRVGKDQSGPEAFDVSLEDFEPLRSFAKDLRERSEALINSRKSLAQATLDETSFSEHEKPSEFVERLIEAMAPTVHEIDEHSMLPEELVLRRQLGHSRREEIFVSKAELLDMLSVLPPVLRRMFEPLRLGQPNRLGRVSPAAPAAEESRDSHGEVATGA